MSRPPASFARLLKLLRKRGRSHEEAEDLIQEAYLRLHEYCKTQVVKEEEAFLVRAVLRLSIDRHRRERRHLYTSETVEDLDAQASLVDESPPVDEALAAQQRLDKIRATLDAVSQRTREIYIAHRAGYGYAEIAAHLRISESAVQKHVARAVLALMEEEGEE
jgi:RNA polymerase sigma factor (sigma-70 family)